MLAQQTHDQAKTTTQETAAPALMITPREAANIAGVSTRTITRLCERDEIRAAKLGGSWRINRAAFLQRLGLAE